MVGLMLFYKFADLFGGVSAYSSEQFSAFSSDYFSDYLSEYLSDYWCAYLATCLSACLFLYASPVSCAESLPENSVPIKYAAGHLLVIPAKVCGQDSLLILDTGCGVNVISQSLTEKYSCKVTGMHSGQRMSGQRLKMKIASLPSLKIGTFEQKRVPVAQWKVEEILGSEPDFKGVEGFVSLDFFKNTPFTIDYHQKKLFIENAASLQERVKTGSAVPIRITRRNGVETSISMPISFTNGELARVEVDTGSSALILDEKYMKRFGISADDKSVRTSKGKDETGHSYTRYFTHLPGDVFPSTANQIRQSSPPVQFQQIIYEGLIGDSFLHNFVVTYDLPHKRMIFSP
jgi:Aspartyl protease